MKLNGRGKERRRNFLVQGCCRREAHRFLPTLNGPQEVQGLKFLKQMDCNGADLTKKSAQLSEEGGRSRLL